MHVLIFKRIILTIALLGAVGSAQAQEACASLFLPLPVVRSAGQTGINYYLSKLKEMRELDSSAPKAVLLRALIMSTTTEVNHIMVPLNLLKLIHPITRPEAMDKLKLRTQALQAQFPNKNTAVILTEPVLKSILPSKNSMRVIKTTEGEYVIFDGNGRLVAIQNAFGSTRPDVLVEVEIFRSTSPLLQATLRDLRTMRGVDELAE